jgi:hypothetical protein
VLDALDAAIATIEYQLTHNIGTRSTINADYGVAVAARRIVDSARNRYAFESSNVSTYGKGGAA